MADSNKPSWSFGQSGTSGSSGALFGQVNSNSSKPAGNLFGSTTNPPTTSGISPFGNTSTAGGSALFGRASGTTPAPTFGICSGSNLFGGGNRQSGGLSGQAVTAPAPSSGFSGFSTPNKPAEALMTSQSQAPSLFSGSNGKGNTSNLFSNIGTNKTFAEQNSTTTPTSKPAISLFGNSTTPAGPPPINNTGANAGSSIFGKPADSGNPFPKQSANPTLGGFTFGSSKSLESPASMPTQAPNPFASAASTESSDLFAKRPAPTEGGLFQNLNKSQDTGANKTTTLHQPQGEASKNTTPFGTDSQASTNPSTAQGTPSLFSMAKLAQPEASTANSVASPTAATGGFSFPKKPTSSDTTSSSSAPSLFGNLGKPQDKNPTTTAESTGMSVPSSSAPASDAGLFGNIGKPAAPASASAGATTQPAGIFGGKPAVGLGASTAGPAPAPQSRLKNKSMDDIINRWATDLSKYQKEFQQQAEKVSTWDRMLVENSEKIQKLYGSTLEAERATTEVERQLTAVEGDQEELSHWLDYYEKQVDSMISNTIGQDGAISGPDQERERT